MLALYTVLRMAPIVLNRRLNYRNILLTARPGGDAGYLLPNGGRRFRPLARLHRARRRARPEGCEARTLDRHHARGSAGLARRAGRQARPGLPNGRRCLRGVRRNCRPRGRAGRRLMAAPPGGAWPILRPSRALSAFVHRHGHLAALPGLDVPLTAGAPPRRHCSGGAAGEVRGARWEEIDFGSATWTVPASRIKMVRPHRAPLSARAVELIDEARTLSFRLPCVLLPGSRTTTSESRSPCPTALPRRLSAWRLHPPTKA